MRDETDDSNSRSNENKNESIETVPSQSIKQSNNDEVNEELKDRVDFEGEDDDFKIKEERIISSVMKQSKSLAKSLRS